MNSSLAFYLNPVPLVVNSDAQRGGKVFKKSEMFCRSLSTLVNLKIVLRQFSLISIPYFPKNKNTMKYGNTIAKIYIGFIWLSCARNKSKFSFGGPMDLV